MLSPHQASISVSAQAVPALKKAPKTLEYRDAEISKHSIEKVLTLKNKTVCLRLSTDDLKRLKKRKEGPHRFFVV